MHGNVLFDRDAIKRRVREIARAISTKYQGKDIVLVGVLKGAIMFLHDLGADLEQIRSEPGDLCTGNVFVEFLSMDSYGQGVTSGDLRLELDLRRSVEGMRVILVEDTADTCKTLAWLVEHLRKKHPLSLEVCVLIDKSDKHSYTVDLHYIGFGREGLPFLAGYGMDEDGAGRFRPDIYDATPVASEIASGADDPTPAA